LRRMPSGAAVALQPASGGRLAACVPMHTFGHPCRISEILAICNDYGIPVVEDAAESLGSRVGERHTGTFGRLGVLSFNGNKIITTGGGGMILTDDQRPGPARETLDHHRESGRTPTSSCTTRSDTTTACPT
jgi:dTDP-4-amino-4,6-dideoxygalactose transaminase